MKMLPLSAACLIISIFSFGQDTVNVVEKTLKIAGMSPATEYYGFAEGDKLIFTVYLDKGELKDISIAEYPNNVKFSDHNSGRIDKKVIIIPQKGIYKFDYYNAFLLPRNVSIKIQRIPADSKTRSFNTNVKWIDKTDTTYDAPQETYSLGADTTFEEVINSTISLTSNKNNQNKAITDFTLPPNTLKWVFWFGAGEEAKQAFETDQKKFTEVSLKPKNTINPLAGLALGSMQMTQLATGDNVHYYFFSNETEAQNFNKGAAFKFFKQGESPTSFALMNYANKNTQKYYFGLRNDNAEKDISVIVKILAVVVNNKYKAVSERMPRYTTHKVPVNE